MIENRKEIGLLSKYLFIYLFMIITFNKSKLIYLLFSRQDARQFYVQGLKRLQDFILC